MDATKQRVVSDECDRLYKQARDTGDDCKRLR